MQPHIPAQIAVHFQQVYHGGNWASSYYKSVMADIDWEMANQTMGGCNSIASLFFHTQYYIGIVLKVLQGGPLQGSDKESFVHPPVHNEAEWEAYKTQAWQQADAFAAALANLPESHLWQDFIKPEYHSYYWQMHGLIEHLHYHLGQIVVLKKILRHQA
ncbi:MAG: DUF1572 family protein [Chitinophagaceae bacterium]|nr:DUF1572 family protein [Chitinophagaceae bacterium]